MVEYTKEWLPLERQVDRLVERGIDAGDRSEAAALLEAIGYYRLTGYLYPFRNSESYLDEEERSRIRVLSGYRPARHSSTRRTSSTSTAGCECS